MGEVMMDERCNTLRERSQEGQSIGTWPRPHQQATTTETRTGTGINCPFQRQCGPLQAKKSDVSGRPGLHDRGLMSICGARDGQRNRWWFLVLVSERERRHRDCDGGTVREYLHGDFFFPSCPTLLRLGPRVLAVKAIVVRLLGQILSAEGHHPVLSPSPPRGK